jgi:plastocyanin
MSITTKLTVAVAAVAGLFLSAVGIVSPVGARPIAGFNVDQANPTIAISNEGGNYLYSPAEAAAKVGQDITITNNDPNGVHTVTAKDGSFSLDVPPRSSVTLTVSKAGTFPYFCQYHPDAHNPASITVS